MHIITQQKLYHQSAFNCVSRGFNIDSTTSKVLSAITLWWLLPFNISKALQKPLWLLSFKPLCFYTHELSKQWKVNRWSSYGTTKTKHKMLLFNGLKGFKVFMWCILNRNSWKRIQVIPCTVRPFTMQIVCLVESLASCSTQKRSRSS